MLLMKTNQQQTFAAILGLALALLGSGVNSWAADKGSIDAGDMKFMKHTGEEGMAEVKIAELGTQKAQSADVKNFAKMLVDDHTKANSELAALAKNKSVDLSAMVTPKAADEFRDLEKHSGTDFDKAFLDHMLKSHKDTVSKFEDIEKNGKDSELKAWVSKTLPTLRAHLDKAKELRGKQ
jgi:putative membrane protein